MALEAIVDPSSEKATFLRDQGIKGSRGQCPVINSEQTLKTTLVSIMRMSWNV